MSNGFCHEYAFENIHEWRLSTLNVMHVRLKRIAR